MPYRHGIRLSNSITLRSCYVGFVSSPFRSLLHTSSCLCREAIREAQNLEKLLSEDSPTTIVADNAKESEQDGDTSSYHRSRLRTGATKEDVPLIRYHRSINKPIGGSTEGMSSSGHDSSKTQSIRDPEKVTFRLRFGSSGFWAARRLAEEMFPEELEAPHSDTCPPLRIKYIKKDFYERPGIVSERSKRRNKQRLATNVGSKPPQSLQETKPTSASGSEDGVPPEVVSGVGGPNTLRNFIRKCLGSTTEGQNEATSQSRNRRRRSAKAKQQDPRAKITISKNTSKFETLSVEEHVPISYHKRYPSASYRNAQVSLGRFVRSKRSRLPPTLMLEPEVAVSFSRTISVYTKERFTQLNYDLIELSQLVYDVSQSGIVTPEWRQNLVRSSEQLYTAARETKSALSLWWKAWVAARPAVLHSPFEHRSYVHDVAARGHLEDYNKSTRELLNVLDWTIKTNPDFVLLRYFRRAIRPLLQLESSRRNPLQYRKMIVNHHQALNQFLTWSSGLLGARPQNNYEQEYQRLTLPIRQALRTAKGIRTTTFAAWHATRYFKPSIRDKYAGEIIYRLEALRILQRDLSAASELYHRTVSYRLQLEEAGGPWYLKQRKQTFPTFGDRYWDELYEALEAPIGLNHALKEKIVTRERQLMKLLFNIRLPYPGSHYGRSKQDWIKRRDWLERKESRPQPRPIDPREERKLARFRRRVAKNNMWPDNMSERV